MTYCDIVLQVYSLIYVIMGSMKIIDQATFYIVDI